MKELNLLPPARRSLLKRESLMIALQKFVESLVAGLLVSSLVAILIVVSLRLLTIASGLGSSQQLKAAVQEYQDQRNIIAKQNLFLRQVGSYSQNRIVWSEFLDDVIKVVSSGVTFDSISGQLQQADKAAAPSGVLVVKGQAVTRNALTVFEGRLRVLPGAVEVRSPTSNLLERDNPAFEFGIVISPTKVTSNAD